MEIKEKYGNKCECCGKYWEDCREEVSGDKLAEFVYCQIGKDFSHCHDCSLVNYGMDCKNNKINEVANV